MVNNKNFIILQGSFSDYTDFFLICFYTIFCLVLSSNQDSALSQWAALANSFHLSMLYFPHWKMGTTVDIQEGSNECKLL